MAEAIEITTDAPLGEVMALVAGRFTKDGIWPEDKIGAVNYLVAESGANITVSRDLKLYEDEYESCIDVKEWDDEGAARRIFDVLAEELEERVTLFAPSSADIVAEANTS